MAYSEVARFLAAALPRLQHAHGSSGGARREAGALASYDEADERRTFEEPRRGSRRFERR